MGEPHRDIQLGTELPMTIEAIDHEIAQVKTMLKLVQPQTRPMLWERIDLLLDHRLMVATATIL